MRRKIFHGYQRPEFPAVPYTPTNVWRTMSLLEGAESVSSQEPIPNRRTDATGHPMEEEPDDYRAVFYFPRQNVTVVYGWNSYRECGEATVTLLGEEDKIDEISDLIFREHRRLREKQATARLAA